MWGWLSAEMARASRWRRWRLAGVAGHLGREHLERDGAVQTCVPTLVHLAHAAGAEQPLDAVGAELRPGGKGHGTNPVRREAERRDLVTAWLLVSRPLLTVPATDGFALGATWHGAERPARVALIAPATGVRRRLYEGYARYLAESGWGVLTWDWRGTGDSRPRSLRGFPATMRGWAERDLEGVLRWARARFPAAPLAVVGHSFGGQAIGLAPSARDVAAVVTVAAQSGYWGHWPPPRRYLYARPLARLAAAPDPRLRLLPGPAAADRRGPAAGVALEWARWCRRPEYLGDWRGHAAFTAPILALSFADDPYAPRAAVEALHARYGKGDFRHRHLPPRDVGVERIGHFGFFRPGIEPLWRETADWLTRLVPGRKPAA